jgi:hypothetical protein
MKILVVTDRSGKIVGTAQQSNQPGASTVGVAPHPNYTPHMVDLPPELEGKPLLTLHRDWFLDGGTTLKKKG